MENVKQTELRFLYVGGMFRNVYPIQWIDTLPLKCADYVVTSYIFIMIECIEDIIRQATE